MSQNINPCQSFHDMLDLMNSLYKTYTDYRGILKPSFEGISYPTRSLNTNTRNHISLITQRMKTLAQEINDTHEPSCREYMREHHFQNLKEALEK